MMNSHTINELIKSKICVVDTNKSKNKIVNIKINNFYEKFDKNIRKLQQIQKIERKSPNRLSLRNRKNDQNKNNNIVILNMPSNNNLINDQILDFIQSSSIKQHIRTSRQLSNNSPDLSSYHSKFTLSSSYQNYPSKKQLFTNIQLNKNLSFNNKNITNFNINYKSTQINKENNNFIQIKEQYQNDIHNDNEQNYQKLKRYNSLDIRIGTSISSSGRKIYGLNNNNNIQNVFKGSQNQNINIINNDNINSNIKSKCRFQQFKPSFKQNIFKLRPQIYQQIKLKKLNLLKKSNFNHFRAISTSSGYKRSTFQKLLDSVKKQKQQTQFNMNPQIQKLDLQKCSEPVIQTVNIRKKAQTAYKSWRKGIVMNRNNSNNNMNKQKQQQCRPWSGNKKNQINVNNKNTQEENPFNFYSIN